MPEDSSEHISATERLAPPDFDKVELPPPLSSDVQPSRTEITPFVPKRKLYLKPDLPHHGQLHGEETMVWTAVVRNQAYQDVLTRRGQEAADELLEKIDEKALLYAAAYHDCARMSDWPRSKSGPTSWPTMLRIGYPSKVLYHGNEYKRHGPLGADLITQPRQIIEIDPTLTDEQIAYMKSIIHNHTPDAKDRVARANEKRRFEVGEFHIEDYDDPEKLMLRLMQEADALALVRTWYSHPTYGRILNPLVSRKRTEKLQTGTSAHVERNLMFPQSSALIPLTHAHHAMDRHDPELNKMFPGHDRSGVALEAGQKLGILKP